MKYLIVLGDGMADYPIKELDNRTPLMAAHTPHIDKLCALGRTGLFKTIPDGMPPGSEVANMAVLGYNVEEIFEGRGVLEAASMGVELEENDLAMRCNLICLEQDKIKNHSGGHISTSESHALIDALKEGLQTERILFYPGVSYRHLLVIKDGKKNFMCTPPHDIPGKAWRQYLPKSESQPSPTRDILEDLIIRSQEILSSHPVNLKREKENKDMANSIWPWSPGHKPKMKTLQELYGINGAMISAVDLLHGIGIFAGMKPIFVEGATGLHDTNYEGKVEAAIEALNQYDLVYLHIEASDEAGHEGDHMLKKKTIEYLDERVIKRIVKEIENGNDNLVVALTPDHATPCALKTHTMDPVPFIIYHPRKEGDGVQKYDEESVKKGAYGQISGDQFIQEIVGE